MSDPIQPGRLGITYSSSAHDYDPEDLDRFLPMLSQLGLNWITLIAPHRQTISEPFVRKLSAAGLNIVLSFRFSNREPFDPLVYSEKLKNYRRWGVQSVQLFDRPNLQHFWRADHWADSHLVDRFLDQFIPAARLLNELDFRVIFPALEPGGDYWDTAFLKESLHALQSRAEPSFLDRLTLGAYADVNKTSRSLDWGSGGPERWPMSRPYQTPKAQQDQRGFNIFEWYLAITKSILGRSLPILLFELPPDQHKNQIDEYEHTRRMVSIAQCMNQSTLEGVVKTMCGSLQIPPPEVICFNYWRLTGEPEDLDSRSAWLRKDGSRRSIADTLIKITSKNQPAETSKRATIQLQTQVEQPEYYLLLPQMESAELNQILTELKPVLFEIQPKIGFDLEEAKKASQVLMLRKFKEQQTSAQRLLSHSGCKIEWISPGTQIASISTP